MNSESRVVKITRSELYRRVWETPMRSLAREYGLSDVGLAKICKRFLIPRPAVGYWAKQKSGKRTRRTPLPRTSDPSIETIEFLLGSPEPLADTEETLDEDFKQLLDRAQALPTVIVPAAIRNLHPLVAATKNALGNKTNSDCLTYFGSRPNVEGACSPSHFES